MSSKRSPYGIDRLPEAFWLSPEGMVVPVNLHPEVLMLIPEMFGLERAPKGKAEIEEAMASVIRQGWARARTFPGGIGDFQIHRADSRSIGEIVDLLCFHHDDVKTIRIRTVEPWKAWDEILLAEFLDGKCPSAWLGGAKRKKRR